MVPPTTAPQAPPAAPAPTFPDLVSPVYAEAEKRIARRPCHTNHASSLGGPCERQLVYDRVAWEEAELPSVDLQVIFEQGGQHEAEVLRAVSDAGFRVIEQQSTLEWKEFQITGHVDAVVVVGEEGIPIDVKSMSPWIWDSVAFRGKGVYGWDEVADAFQRKPWLKRYLGQITLYALLKNTDRGILLLKNKATGALAQVNVLVDLDYAEELVQRAIRINACVDAGTLPERISWNEDTCGGCPYLGKCLPDRVGRDPLIFLEDSTVEALLEERATLEEDGKLYESIDKRIKAWAKARPELKITIGNFLIQKAVSATRTVVKVERLAEGGPA